MRLIFLACFFLLLTFSCLAQEPRINYGGMQQLGIAIAVNAIEGMPNLINGVRYKSWFAGLGVAYEMKNHNGRFNGVNTMPIYLDVRHYFFKKKWVFALADVGTTLLVGNEWMNDARNGTYKKYKGYYGNVGCGVKSRLGQSTFYSFDVSYNFKQTRYDRVWRDWQGRSLEESNNFKQQRILIRLGLEIN